MSLIIADVTSQALRTNEYFSFDVYPRKKSTKITMKMLIPTVTTEGIPTIIPILKTHLPSILRSKCFNENNYRFSKEVKNTEIGHLFEHIMLEYLSDFKYALGIKGAIYNGLTRWNWVREERGVFHIEIDAGREDKDIFELAVQKSTKLLLHILRSTKHTQIQPSLSMNTNFLTLGLHDTETIQAR
jgi:hypothetical protein